jgi:hypothetical protein
VVHQVELRQWCISLNCASGASGRITPVVHQLELRQWCIRSNTPKAFANFSPGLELSDNPGVVFRFSAATLKALANRGAEFANAFSVTTVL